MLLYIMLAYLVLCAELLNDVCLYYAFYCQTFANDFCLHALFWFIDTFYFFQGTILHHAQSIQYAGCPNFMFTLFFLVKELCVLCRNST